MNDNFFRPSWDEYFMLSAIIAATRSSCIKFNSGAVIVKNKRIIASGYNGNPPGVKSCFEQKYCNKDVAGIDWSDKGSGHCLATHAEANAIIQNHEKDLTGSTLYCLHFPCNECAKLITSSGIKEVVYLKMYREKVSNSELIFNQAKVKFRKMVFQKEKLIQKMIEVIDSTKE
ncbi:MAG: dCMP deaminase family protein [Candidatus ainarchaeum sp.]|nr:dCMP deaminase family protein [Candidatus ainarchaeum sp.]